MRQRFIVNGPNAGGHPVGTVCFKPTGWDYGLANDDTRITGHKHVSMTTNEDGSGPSFTIREDHLKPEG
jgi:hypothetical protein